MKGNKMNVNHGRMRSFILASSAFILGFFIATIFFTDSGKTLVKAYLGVYEQGTMAEDEIKVPTKEKCLEFINNTGRSQATTWTTKPIWFNMYQFTVDEDFHHRLINPLTNTPKGGKSYYMTTKGHNRHCIGDTETVTCSNIHPKAGVANLDDRYGTTFYEKYIVILRNPMTALPASHDKKERQYHNSKSQPSEEQWKQVRGTWFESMWDDWKSTITAWQNTKYDVGMYLVYEDLLSPHKGPETLRKLGEFLKKAGFEVPALDLHDHDKTAMKEQMYCLWDNLVHQEESDEMMTDLSEFRDYIPTYTRSEKALLLNELEHTMQQFKDDADLVDILGRYAEEIQTKIRIESV